MGRLRVLGMSISLVLGGAAGQMGSAMAAEISVFCTAGPVKDQAGGPAEGWVCDALIQEVAAAYPHATIAQAPEREEADLVLDTKGPGFVARLTWRGQPAGEWTGTALRGRALDASDMAGLIRVLLQHNPHP